jgi:uncharacterized SAM-binding protein YcdF (DUF218 family)
MPPSRPSGGTLRRTYLLVTTAAIALGMYGFDQLGPFLAKEDALQKADAIVVLAGTPMRRPLEAADLYLAGYGSRIVLTRQTREGGERALVERGIQFPEDIARTRDVFLQIGIPAEAIVIPQRIHNSTAAEAITARELAERYGWRRVIVVSSKYHMRRAGFAFRRELRGTSVEVLMRGTRYDGLEPHQWWRRRDDLREIVPEVPKLVAYVLGLGA